MEVTDTPTQLSEQDIDAIEARVNAATEGPWHWRRDYEMPNGSKHWELSNPEGDRSGKTIDASLVLLLDRDEWLHRPAETQPNWEFIAHARTDIPALIRDWRALRKNLDDALVRAAEDQDYDSEQRARLAKENAALREQLAQARAPQMITREDAERFIQQYLHSAQWEDERLMITFENEALIAALIGDVEV